MLGRKRLTDVERHDVQDVVDAMIADGFSGSTIRNAILPLRIIYRRAPARSWTVHNPTRELSLPAVESGPRRVATASEAVVLLADAPERDRAIWATALYAGLRYATTLQVYMRHSTITTTLDLYGHLFPGAENEFIALADGYLEAA